MVYRKFPEDFIPIKSVNQEEIHRKTISSKLTERRGAAYLFRINFAHFPDKELAFEDLHRLTQDEDRDVRRYAAESLGEAFPYIPDKELAFEDLYRLSNDKEFLIQRAAALSLGAAFPYISDRNMKQAWEDLHMLTKNRDRDVRIGAAFSLGVVYPLITNEGQALEDLHRLRLDRDSYVRAFANYSLGKACIFDAAKAKSVEVFKKELKNSLGFFYRSLSEEISDISLACLLFYSSFYAIVFERQKAEAEVQEYIEETRSALRDSGEEEKFLEAIENAKIFLKEIRGLKEADLEIMKRNLIVCMQYCDSADFLESKEEEIFPVEINIIIRGLPVINQRIREKVYNIRYESLGAKQLAPEKWQCVSCGILVPSGAQFCPHCGKTIDKCSVCGKRMSSGEALVECPHCGILSHWDHLLEWIKVKGYCPNCKVKLSREDIIKMGVL